MLTEEKKREMLEQLEVEITGLKEQIPWFEQHRLDRDIMEGWAAYCDQFIPLLKEGLRICQEQRFDLLTYGELKKRY